MSAISRGFENLHPVKANLHFIIGVKGAGISKFLLTHCEEKVNVKRKAEPTLTLPLIQATSTLNFSIRTPRAQVQMNLTEN
jgi:hypothetical protein